MTRTMMLPTRAPAEELDEVSEGEVGDLVFGLGGGDPECEEPWDLSRCRSGR